MFKVNHSKGDLFTIYFSAILTNFIALPYEQFRRVTTSVGVFLLLITKLLEKPVTKEIILKCLFGCLKNVYGYDDL